jgi:AcrR family transcriptional regulator
MNPPRSAALITGRRGRPCAAISGETRGRIIAAARAVFTELGYHAATFGAIANRADVSRAAIEYHFETKQKLWTEVVGETHSLVFDAGLPWAPVSQVCRADWQRSCRC